MKHRQCQEGKSWGEGRRAAAFPIQPAGLRAAVAGKESGSSSLFTCRAQQTIPKPHQDPSPTHCCSWLVGDEGVLLFPMVNPGAGWTPTPGWIILLLPAPHSLHWNWLPSSLLLLQVKAALHSPSPLPSPSAGKSPLHLPTPGMPPTPLAHHR